MELNKNDNPLLLTHVKILRGFMCSLGVWPVEAFGQKAHIRNILSTFLIVLAIFSTGGQTSYLLKNMKRLTFFELVDSCITLLITILTSIRVILPKMKSYGNVVKVFLLEFHLDHFKHKGYYYNKKCTEMIKVSHYFTLAMFSMMFCAVIFFNFSCSYHNIVHWTLINNKTENYTFQYSIYYTIYPSFHQDDHFALSTTMNVYLCFLCSILVCGIDTLMALMAFQIIGHIQILLNDIKNITKPKHEIIINVFSQKTDTQTNVLLEIYDSQENRYVRDRLIEFVKHHKLIINFAESVSKFFGPILAINYFYHLVGCAILLLACLKADPATLGRYVFITAATFSQLVQTSVIFEVIGSESEKLKDAVYSMPWECMNISNQRLVWIFLNRIQIPIRVTALGVADVGVQTMAAILKTTFSYLTLLQSMDE